MAAKKSVRTVGVIVNRSKGDAARFVRLLREYEASPPTGALRVKFLWERSAAALAGVSGLALEALVRRKPDLLLVAGGDGSLLEVAERVHPAPVPILGVNLGRLGSLTGLAMEELPRALPDIARGRLDISPRLVLEGQLQCQGRKPRAIACALNEVAIVRGPVSRLVRLRLKVNGRFVTEYQCDGLLAATPTGSTAYNLAAGGPLLAPEASALVLTPLAPHTLTNRSLVVDGNAVIEIEVPPQPQALIVQADGRFVGRLQGGDRLVLQRTSAPVLLAYLPHTDFFELLRHKLHWTGASLSMT
jgi:NAD+ kinase